MTTWKDYKQSITNINDDEVSIIDTLSQLQAERIKQGISQKAFGERIAMKQSQLAKIERLDSMPSLTTLKRYADGLGLEIKEFNNHVVLFPVGNRARWF